MRLRKKKLEMILSHLLNHPSPDPKLEQYNLSPRAAAEAVTWAWDNGHIEERKVCDLGCGTGILSLSAALSGARKVLGVDLDPVALDVARENINIADRTSGLRVSGRIELKQTDVALIDARALGAFDTVIQNPPFGVQLRTSDRIFLRKALELAPIIYSLHKKNADVEKFIRVYVDQLGGVVQGKISIDVPIPHQFSFHRKPSYIVAADLFLIRRKDFDQEKD